MITSMSLSGCINGSGPDDTVTRNRGAIKGFQVRVARARRGPGPMLVQKLALICKKIPIRFFSPFHRENGFWNVMDSEHYNVYNVWIWEMLWLGVKEEVGHLRSTAGGPKK